MILLILAISFILRFYQLGVLPPALDWDEASTVYNAYSIIETGRDEFGQNFPFLFRAFDGYVPPVLVYLNILSVSFFGLNEFAARSPNAFLGVLTVFGVYLLVRKLTKNEKLSLLAALFLAISPWHIIYSRVNFFASLPVFFVIFGSYFFLLGMEKNRYLIFSIVSFLLAIFSYFSAYIFVPLLALFLAVFNLRRIGFGRVILFLLPIFLASFLILFVIPGGQNRFRGISVFADADILKKSSHEAQGEGIVGKILHNRRLVYTQKFLEGYFANFRYDFLFGKGDSVSRMVVPGYGFGLLYLWDLPFLLIGFYFLTAKKPPGWQLFLAWLILAPVAASVTLPAPASTRMTVMIPVLTTVTAWGFWFYTKSKPRIVTIFLLLLLTFNFLIFSHQYFVHFAKETSSDWFYGYRQLFDFLNNKNSLDRKLYFVFRQHDSLDQIHMFTLFYNKVEPSKYQASGGTRLGCMGGSGQFTFERYNFVPYSCLSTPFDLSKIKGEDLIITSREIESAWPYKQIGDLGGNSAFFIYEYKNVSGILGGFILR